MKDIFEHELNADKKRVVGLVIVAGMSSRMKRFKPLLKLGDMTLIEHVITTLQEGGVQEIIIVTGKCADSIKRQIENKRVHFINNDYYETTTMFESVKLGLTYIKDKCDEFFFIPGDIPLFQTHSIIEMKKIMDNSNSKIVQPKYKGKRGHPVLFSSDCIDSILHHDGTNGLKGAIAAMLDGRIEIDVPDKGILLDADTPEDFKYMENYFIRMNVPDEEVCFEILKYFKTDSWVVEHSIKVAQVARELTLKSEGLGYMLNVDLIQASALLHDIARREKNHEMQGGKWLRELGYTNVAEIVEVHMDVPEEAIQNLDERAIVYLADKLVIKTKEVTLEERFERAYVKNINDQEAKEAINNRLNKARRILQRIKQMEDDKNENCAS